MVGIRGSAVVLIVVIIIVVAVTGIVATHLSRSCKVHGRPHSADHSSAITVDAALRLAALLWIVIVVITNGIANRVTCGGQRTTRSGGQRGARSRRRRGPCNVEREIKTHQWELDKGQK